MSESSSGSSSESASDSSSESSSESTSESSSESSQTVFCGCYEPIPSYITVRLNGITDGTDCDQCEQLNADYSVELDTSHPDYCDWILDVGPGMEFYLRVRIAYGGPNNYYIEVWLYMRHDLCPNNRDNNLYWYHEQTTPYDCSNLNLAIPLLDDEAPTGCSGGSCRILS